MTSADIKRIRDRADSDVFYFARVICGHNDLTREDHAPLMYAAAGDTARFLAMLRDTSLQSYTLKQCRKEAGNHGIDIRDEDAEGRLAEKIRVVDIRVYRGSGKSSALTHAVRLWKMVIEPNMSSALITNTEDKAKDFCRQIRATIQSTFFGIIYPDRLPADPKGMLTENRLTLAGRTVPDKEPCLMVFGHKASPTGYHFDEIDFDDLVARENRSLVEIAVARDFLSNTIDLQNPGIRFPLRRVHKGTRWDEMDDCEFVRRYRHCFGITVPIWHRDKPTDDIRIAGVPTTKWKDLAACMAKQEEILSNPDEGAISWRCNNELDPTVGGGRIFPPELVDNAKWVKHVDLLTTKGRTFVRRPQFDANGQRLEKDRAFDPDTLYKVMAFDQSFSEDGDEWAGAVEGMDQFGHRFLLERRTGHGLEAMLDAAEMLRLTWNPRRAGMEKIAAQHAIELVMKFGAKYQRLRPLIEPIPHNNYAKEWRIRNYVAEIMKMKRLWLHPDDVETSTEMKKYKPGKNAKDNILDALAMCEVLIQKSLAPKGEEDDYRKKFARINARNQQRRDQRTGVSLW